jgi:hypothetical protein
VTRIKVCEGTVTAACFAPETGDVFLGSEFGHIYCFRPLQREVVRLPTEYSFGVVSLATDPKGTMVVAVTKTAQSREGRQLSSYVRSRCGMTWCVENRPIESAGEAWLTPVVVYDGGYEVGLWNGEDLCLLQAERGGVVEKRRRVVVEDRGVFCGAALLLHCRPGGAAGLNILMIVDDNLWCHSMVVDGNLWCRYSIPRAQTFCVRLGWPLSIPRACPLHTVPVSWWQEDPQKLELAGLGETGTLSWTALETSESSLQVRTRNVNTHPDSYLAATIYRAGHVAAVSRSGIDWLRCGDHRFSLLVRESIAIPDAVACFPSPATSELIVVCRDGEVVPVAVPN